MLEYLYDDAAAEKLSRVRTLRWQGNNVVRYTYLGVGTFVATDYLEPQVKLDYATGAGANRYAGWDRFGRIVDLLWQSYAPESSSSSEEPPGLVHLQYGYDRASNRTHRKDLVARHYDKNFDERYEYDGLHRLKKFHRGRLVDSNTVIESPTLQQGWRLDATGNWQNFTQQVSSDPAQTLDQTRVSNCVNEITQIARTVGPSWATPSYDRNGNMTVIPRPKDMTQTYQATWDAYQQTLRTLGISCSMSRTGCCYDNAVMERFFWSLKHEWTNHEDFHHLEAARLSVFRYIETFYNPQRLHQTLGYLSPNQFEAVHAPAHAA